MRDVIQSGIFTLSSNIVTTATPKLIAGLYLYSLCTVPGSIISTIGSGGSAGTITISKNAYKAYTGNIRFTDSNPFAYSLKMDALRQVKYEVDFIGNLVQFNYREESDVTRDDYNSIKAKNIIHNYYMKCYPIVKNPSADKLEKAGLRDESDLLLYLPTLSLNLLGFTFDDIDKNRMTIKVDNQTYEIKEKSEVGQIANEYCYVTLGLFKK
jgi:hypothetical protein